jgi:hypothetical protein
MKKNNSRVYVAFIALFAFLAVLTFIGNKYNSAYDDSSVEGVNLAPRLSTRNFCLDRDGSDVGTANTALEINIPNGLLVPTAEGGYVFGPSITGVTLLSSSSGGSFYFSLNDGTTQPPEMRITLLDDEVTSAGNYKEWVSSNSNAGEYNGEPGQTGPVSSPGAVGASSVDDKSYESPCRNVRNDHNYLAGKAPTSIKVTFAGSNGQLPVIGSATGASISNNQVTFNSNAGYVRRGTSP